MLGFLLSMKSVVSTAPAWAKEMGRACVFMVRNGMNGFGLCLPIGSCHSRPSVSWAPVGSATAEGPCRAAAISGGKVWDLPKSRWHLELLQAVNCPQLVSWESGVSMSINGKEYIPLSHILCVFFNLSVSILLSLVGEVLWYVLSPCHEHIS